ncbi:transcription factor SPT20 homolog [Drosophila sulfurigaster albostrigata]|uniref:transcription factor SPT20 homolog n=1 Tax=Drosophila sulfurigaster albostrigata TaxID=89887 RepID=UPI002D21E100|nr:transcription factor SPT20 homolog [Drosophila sulfurigaster albostrigata]
MRAFILTCLVGLALAAPQGYNYQSNNLQLPGIPGLPGIPNIAQQAVSIDEQRVLQQALQAPKVQQLLSTSSVGSQQQQTQTQTIYQQPQQQQIFQQQPQQQPQQLLPANFGFNFQQQQQQQPQQQQYQNYNPSASLVSKDIYVHVPPAEEPEERYPQPQLPIGPPRKHYRIVFIKAPTPSASKAAVRVKQAPVEEKTIIYVLTKKPDPLDLQAAIEEAAPKQISKPEVFFIKYKTQEEAAHAQRTIQAQYDQLGGTTQISDEGVAPVTSVIGALDNQRATVSSTATATATGNVNAIGGLAGAIPSKYLPSHLRA